jgi:hypothetical protein
MEVDVTYVFDELVARHMERLIGSRFGIGGLQLTVGTIACLSLLDEQSGEETPGEKNTLEALHGKLAELGLRDREKAESLIQEMVSKEYILADDQGKISGGKPALSMCRLMERLFPKMQGKTLIAYFVQTIDEVLTGRKNIETAVAHFDQTLKMQGVPLKSAKPEKPPKGSSTDEKKSEKLIKETPRTFSIPRIVGGEERTGFRIIGSSLEGVSYKVEAAPVVSVSSTPSKEKEPEASPDESEQILPAAVSETEQAETLEPPAPLEPSTVGSDAPVSQPTSPLDGPPTEEMEEPAVVGGDSPAKAPPPVDEQTKPPIETSMAEPEAEALPGEVEDELIEKAVAEFHDDLAASCPLCKTGKVREQQTGTGRVYYKCSNKACNLVSWGRPYYLACPHCKNPFLVEVAADEGGLKLRCPRSTCSYRCTVPPGGIPEAFQGSGPTPGAKPKKRLVRRRVVRRKK